MIEKNIKIYHVETQEDYDDLMIKLEAQGYKWFSGDKPTEKPEYWVERKENTAVILNGFKNYRMTRGSLDYHKRTYPFTTVIKHKAKGAEQLEKVVVPKFVADYIDKQYGGNKPNIEDKAELIRDWDRYVVSCGDFKLEEWVDDDTNFLTFVIAIATNDYEVEKENKYYWRKKKEYLCVFEEQEELYLNVNKETGKLSLESKTEIGIIQTSLTETEVRRIVSKEDFIKLEKVEITE